MRSEVQVLPDPPSDAAVEAPGWQGRGKSRFAGAIAQLGERLPCTQEVGSSILPGSTIPGQHKVVDVAVQRRAVCVECAIRSLTIRLESNRRLGKTAFADHWLQLFWGYMVK